MDISKIISDAGAYGSISKVKPREDVERTRDNDVKNESVQNNSASNSELVLKLIQESEKQAPSKDSLEKEPQSKGLFIDAKV